jgi:hypothetical protein
MRRIVYTVIGALQWLALCLLPLPAQQKPNIVVIFGDEIGYWNVSAYNHGLGWTSNIDNIAQNGILIY